ncbi:MAG: hypothetical protein G01um101472_604, partial [Parcubacteria group bacterium Gr01-1014_72]
MKKLIIGLSLAFSFAVIPAVSSAQTQSNEALQALVAQLLQQVASLTQQLNEARGGTSSPVPDFCHTFTRYVAFEYAGNRAEDVRALNTVLAREGLAQGDSLGNPSEFSENTAAAVVEFQKKYGIQTTGLVGPKTRAKLNSLCSASPTLPPPIFSTWKTYINVTDGYELKYPSDWKAQENVDGSVRIFNPSNQGAPDTDQPSEALGVAFIQKSCTASNWEVGFGLVNYKTACVSDNPPIHVTMVAFSDQTKTTEDRILGTFKFTTTSTKPSITVLSPNGGEAWQLRNTHTILWTPYDPQRGVNPAITAVEAFVEKQVNGVFVPVGKVVPSGKASIHWDGDINSYGTYPEPGEYYIRIQNNLTGASDRSDKPFKLVAHGTITADLKVNGSDNEITAIPAGGADYKISWTSNAESCSFNNGTTDYSSGTLQNLPSSGERTVRLYPNTSGYDTYLSISCIS